MHLHDPCQHGYPPHLFWMAPPAACKENELANPAFFAAQSQKLNALLSTVVRESSTATNPDAAIDFMQLTEIISSLLEESQMFSVLSGDELQQRSEQVRSFMGKIDTVQSVIDDWDVRTKTTTTAAPVTNGVIEKPRKRARTSTGGHADYDTRANRRRLESETEQALNMAPTFDGPYAEMLPLKEYEEREREQAAWWEEPYYD